jgi:hypothetical protein
VLRDVIEHDLIVQSIVSIVVASVVVERKHLLPLLRRLAALVESPPSRANLQKRGRSLTLFVSSSPRIRLNYALHADHQSALELSAGKLSLGCSAQACGFPCPSFARAHGLINTLHHFLLPLPAIPFSSWHTPCSAET